MKLGKQLLRINIESQMKNAYCAPLMLAGKPGIAKTQATKEIAKEMKMGLLQVNCATLALHTITGLPSEVEADNGEIYTTWSVPEIIAKANMIAREPDTKGCILVLDDFHGLSYDSMNMMLQLLLERAIGEHKLSRDVYIAATMNDSEDAGFEGMPSAIRSRLQLLKVNFDFSMWWDSFGNSLNPIVGSFVQSARDVLTEDESTGLEGSGSSRSIAFMSSQLNSMDTEFIEDNAYRIACQFMSKESAIKFESHAQVFYSMNLEQKVKDRADLDVSNMKTLDKYMHAYVASYVKTENDMKWLINQMVKYVDESAFIGLSAGIIYDNYSGENINDATRYFIMSILEEKNSIFGDSRDKMFGIMKKYLM